MRAYLPIVNAIYVLLASSLCALEGCLPLALVWFLVPSFDYYPLFCVAAALSTPGLAALFAVFRDHPALRPEHSIIRHWLPDTRSNRADDPLAEAQFTPVPDWIASPYVSDDATVAIFRPFACAWRRLALRALSLGAPAAAAIFILLYDIQLLLQVPWGAYLIPLCAVLALLVALSLLVSLMLAVEFPKARWRSLVRNGVLLCVKRLPLALVNLAVCASYVWALSVSPVLVAVLATGLVCYLIYAGARWQMLPMGVALARESHDPTAIALYDPDRTAADPAGRGGLSDFQQ